MPARVVVIGGGITGCSVAYHLALGGWSDVVVLEKGELTSGSTHHAAGLVTMFNPSPTMMRFRRYSVSLYNELGVFNTVGSVRIASSPDSLRDLERTVSRVRGVGLGAALLGPAEVLERMPFASGESLYGGVWMAGDGHVDPHIATHAVADAARALGVEFRLRTRVSGIELGRRHEVRAVITTDGRIETEHVVNAAGVWAPRMAEMVGAQLPSVPVDHQHVLMQAVPGAEVPRGSPCFRDPDNLVYGKDEAGGMLIGGYERNPVARWGDGVPWDHGASPVESDMDRFAPLLEGAIRRFPFLDRSGVIRLLCHPDAMTPDGNPLLGPMPGIPGFWVAAGLSLNGFGGAGGIGRAIAEWMIDGEPELDVGAYHAWRFGPAYLDPWFAAARAREAYRYYYRLRYPLDTDEWGRGLRPSPLQVRLQELGAVFGTKNGWERADHFEPGRPWRRSGADQRRFGWSRPPWFDRVGTEHQAFRECVGIIDMTSFGKIEVTGPGALALLERTCDSRIDRPVGSVIYTQFLNGHGGIVADVTVTRIGEERFRVITGAATVDGDRGWLELCRRADDDAVELRDRSDELAVIGIWGPLSRTAVEACSADDVSDRALPFRQARAIDLGGAPVLAQRITYVGELGFELYVEPEWAVQVWDRLMAAGAEHGITPGGYRALESLRLEKGYRYFGTDLTSADTPYASGLGFCVALQKGEFNGRDALSEPGAADPPRRLRTLTVGSGDEYVTIYGGEAVRHEGNVVGRVRSCGYGYTVRCNIALAMLPAELKRGTELTVDVFGDVAPAWVAEDVLYDPEGSASVAEIRAIVLDFNGTLAEDNHLVAPLYVEMFATVGLTLTIEEYHREFAAMPDRTVAEVALRRAGLPVDDARRDALVRARLEGYMAAVAAEPPITAHAHEFIRAAVAAGIALAVASGAFRREIDHVLRAAGVRQYFKALVSIDDVSNGKPDPEGYIQALAELNGVPGARPIAPGQTVAVEDATEGALAARAAGMRVATIRGMGYDPASGCADLVVDRLDRAALAQMLALGATEERS